MFRTGIIAFLIVFSTAGPALTAEDHLQDVHLQIGTTGSGQTYPAIGMPFAMTHWTPETRSGETKCIAPYYDEDKRLTGFRGTHFMSGSCVRDYGSFTLMPEAGQLKLSAAARGVAFAHDDESMSPERYAVRLPGEHIRAEMSGLTRSGLMRFTFERGGKAWVVVQNHATFRNGWTAVDTERGEITGENPMRRLYAGNGKPAGISGFFIIRFNRKIVRAGVWSGGVPHPGHRQTTGPWDSGVYAGFDASEGKAVEAQIGTSFVSIEEARLNLDGEMHGLTLAGVEARSRAAWADILGTVDVQTTSERRAVFYTALYHAALVPRTLSDLDGNYPAFGGNSRNEHAQGFIYYDDFSIWDTFRAVHPWLTLTQPQRETDMIRSLMEKGRQGGFLPIYPAWNSYTAEMIGDHAGAIVADGYAKGLRGFDSETAYRQMKKNATVLAPPAEYEDGRGRRALNSYLRYGYIPLEDPVIQPFHSGEQVSRTLEYAYDDSLVARMAAALGNKDDEAMFAKRAENWRNVFDPGVGYVRGRHADGSWASPFEPNKTVSWITEGMPSQYTFFVPQNIPGLIEAVGGRAKFVAKPAQPGAILVDRHSNRLPKGVDP